MRFAFAPGSSDSERHHRGLTGRRLTVAELGDGEASPQESRTKGRDMAKKGNTDLVDRLRAGGLRKRVASGLADAIGRGGSRKQPPKAVQSVLRELRSLTDEIEDRATGRTAKRKAAARKGAATRRKNAAKRSGAAKKGARTRAKKR